ncbi:HAD family hydrolase [Halovivax cerinus]|uniref:HAD family hydrolase n=1 Tax=Halovivax cerinus TaxID=1487865 RepID=A0ABD5NPF7_9EURY|nr:HAD-IA family hydrolase [Halovivax cerinus]
MTEYDAVVYDLDGTLVRLDVDWNAVAREVRAIYREAGVEPPAEDAWTLLTGAARIDRREDVESVIAAHECDGAETADRLPLSDHVVDRSIPVGICSLNCESACRIALERHGLLESVERVIGRDSVPAMKPDPEPLLTAIDALPVSHENVLFVGDSGSDATTAERAGVSFQYVEDVLDTE